MRISDWSSDVCSSDLVGLEGAGNGAGARSAEPRGARYSRLCRARRHGQGYLHPRALARRGALSGEDGTEPRRRVLLALIGASRRYEERSEERRVGNESVSTCRSRGWPDHKKKKRQKKKSTN